MLIFGSEPRIGYLWRPGPQPVLSRNAEVVALHCGFSEFVPCSLASTTSMARLFFLDLHCTCDRCNNPFMV